jgi:uncharacterized protein (TIGR00255 family)
MPNEEEGAALTGISGATRSMTGFADVAGETDLWTWNMELRGVNGRGLDLRIRAPEWIEGFDGRARKRLQGTLSRGSVTLNLRVTRRTDSGALPLNPVALAAALETLGAVHSAAKKAGVKIGKTSAADILNMKGVSETPDDTDEIARLAVSLDEAIGSLIRNFDAARASEGAALAQVLTDKLDEIERLTDAAAEAAAARTNDQKTALEAALARLLEAAKVPDEDRLLQEMAVIAVKSDVTEEIDRLRAHVGAARTLLKTPGPVGRKFDFLMQEFNREANTLCSKSGSPALTSIGLDLKTLIDQMREQVQNIE